MHKVNHTFSRLGFWYIPCLSIPLLLFFFSVQSKPPSPQSATSIVPVTKSKSAQGVPSSQIQEQQVFQKLVTASSPSVSETHSPKITPPKKQKTDFKPQKHTVAAKRDNLKSKSKVKTPPYTAPAISIRVALAIGAKDLAVASTTTAKILDVDGKLIQQLPAGQSFLAQPIDYAIALKDWQLPSAIWVEPTEGGAVYVGSRAYRGRLLLISQGSTLLAVNHVDLEQYLMSVVGSEMSASERLEALKAQAIAARSYALVHLARPASSLYDLGASQRWQVYKGLNTEYNTTQAAVSETAGQVLSYQGGIVESTYAATEEIIAKAHGGRGMSQEGAVDLAEQGYGYQQILAVYYPGALVARLELR